MRYWSSFVPLSVAVTGVHPLGSNTPINIVRAAVNGLAGIADEVAPFVVFQFLTWLKKEFNNQIKING